MKPPNFGLRAARVFDKYFRQMINWKLGDWDLKSYDMSVVDSVDVTNGTTDLTLNGSATLLTVPLGKAAPAASDVIPVYKTWRERKHWIEVLSPGWCKTWTLDAEFTAPGTLLDNFMEAKNDQLQLTVLPAGDGRDGAYTHSFTGPIAGCNPQPITATSTGSFSVPNDMSLSPGDKVVLHASICSTFSGDVSYIGYWQVVDIVSQFTGGGFTTYFTQQAVNGTQLGGSGGLTFAQAQKVKQFTTVSIAAGNSITPPWAFNDTLGFGAQASYCGGIVAFMHTGTLFGPGNVNASGFGMQGGAFDHYCSCTPTTGQALSGWSGWGASTDLDMGGVPYKQQSTHGGGMGGFCGDSNDCDKSHGGADCCPCVSVFSPSGGGGGGGLVGSGAAGATGNLGGTPNAAGGGAGGGNSNANSFGYALLGSGGGGSGTNPLILEGQGGRGGGVILTWGNSVATSLTSNGVNGLRQAGGGSGGSVRVYYLPGAGLGSASMFANGGGGGLGLDFGGQLHYGAGGNGGAGSIQMFQIQPRVGCWTSEVVSAINVDPPLSPGTLLTPSNFLTDWMLDSDAVKPIYQIMSSPTGLFAGEETYHPGPTSSDYYQDGTADDINDGASLALAFAPALYWKVRMCLDSGTNTTDTPSVQDMQLCGY